jgi:hypothetical protein
VIQAELTHTAPYISPSRIHPQTLAALRDQTRVYDRLDWWELESWCDSDAFVSLSTTQPESLVAALLAVPIEIADIHRLATARSCAAWLRWCVVVDGQSPSAMLRVLMAETESRLRCANVRELWCACEPHDWLATNLRDLGFKRRDELVTMLRVSRSSSKSVDWVLPRHTTLRVLHPAFIDAPLLAQIHALDAAA